MKKNTSLWTLLVAVAASVITTALLVSLSDRGPHFYPIPGAPHRVAPMFDDLDTAWGSVTKTRLDVVQQFGLPHRVDAVLLLVTVRDAHSFDHDCFVSFGNTELAFEGQEVMCSGLADGAITVQTLIVPVLDDELWFETRASGPDTMNLFVTARGYWK